MEKLLRIALAFMLISGLSLTAYGQCTSWKDNPKKEEAENAHVIYRQYVNKKQPADIAKYEQDVFDLAFSNWKTAYDIAPAADGQRASHYIDGRKLYTAMLQRESDEAKKKEYTDMLLKLYDQEIECYPKNKVGLYGRKAYDMFYSPFFGYRPATAEAFAKAIEVGGNNTEYFILEPYAQVVVYMFKNEQMDQLKAREIVLKLDAISDHNIANNARMKSYFETTKARVASVVAEVEDEIFDCNYFKDKLMPEVEKNPDDLEVLKYAFNKLRMQGCDTTEAFMIDLRKKYETKASEINAALQAEFLANNPGVAAKRAYDDGDFQGAIDLYNEAITKAEEEGDTDKQAEYWFGIASIQFRKLKQYGTARSSARKAASLKSNWGRPYMLIGDMYASTSASCGKDGYTRGLAVLAALDKYGYAKSIDSEVSAEANKKIGLYRRSMPTQDDVFMRGKQGSTDKVGCWIGETVKVRYN